MRVLQMMQLLLPLLLLLADRAAGLTFTSPPGAANSDVDATISLAETTPAGTDIYTITSDTDCTFTLATAGATSCTTTDVQLNGATGLVKTVKLRLSIVMDYETEATRVCPVVCTPAVGAAQTASMTVSLINEIDQAPVPATASFTVNVQEEQTAGSAVQTVSFTDPEVAAIGDVLTCTITGTGASLFTVTYSATTTGGDCIVTTAVKIDRDTLATTVYTGLLVKAVDRSDPSLSNTGTATLVVTITDINDNSPVCTTTSYTASVNENVSSSTVATIATCTDADAGDNATLVYALVGTPAGYAIAGNVISLTAARDYDTITTNPEVIYATVSDSGTTARSISVTVTVSIMPLNDNTPVLTTATTNNTVPESTAQNVVLFTPSATDADKAGEPDSTFTWSILSAQSTAGPSTGLNILDRFSINSATGVIVRGGTALDYESWTAGELVIRVSDQGTSPSALSATQTLTLSVTDVNEFPPTYSPSNYYRVSLAENNVENFTVLNTFLATDPDGSALPVQCTIISGNTDSVFRFNATNANVLELAKTIEPDKPTNHPLLFMLSVECKDNSGTSPYQSSTATIQVDITTANDNTPALAGTSGCTGASPCSEATTTVGTTVATLTASDNDVGTDGEFDCRIAGPAGAPFSLQGCTAVKLSGPLDHETAASYALVVQAVDRGSPQRVRSTTINIVVGDVDDNAPYCLTYDYSFTVPENAAGNDVVGTVNCLDSDAAGVVYTLVPATVPFDVVPGTNNARVRVKNPSTLDYESTTSYTFTLRTTDQGSLGRTTDAVVRVSILPINEQTPTFSNTAINVDEDKALGVVTTFAAVDSDTGGHEIKTYAITAATNSGQTFFSISNSGVVSLIKSLDYETTQQYVLTITATDGGGLVGTGLLTINVADKNDNTPVCANAQVSLTIGESAAAGALTTGTQPVASDADSPASFGRIAYSISAGDTGSYFTINAATGTITRSTTPGLNYEALTPGLNFYNLTVLAIDENGSGPNTATCLARVTVTDVEEGAPIFTPTVASAGPFAESTGAGTVLFTPTYTHVDSWDVPTFTLNPTNPLFSIESSTGKITLLGTMDYETATQHVLTIVATDKNSQTGTMTLTVSVSNVNEFAPVCTPPGTTVYIDENDQSPPSFPKDVLLYSCTDSDAGTTLLYSITSVDGVAGPGSYQFVANQLRTTAALNYEPANTQDILVITVSDQGPGTPNILTMTLTVSINPVNEYSPVFTASSLTPAGVDENVALGTTVATVIATDADKGSNHDTIKYAITAGNAKGYFALAETTGLVTNVKSLDREDAASYLLTVTATDGPGLVTTATLTISLNDINDNNPAFTQAIYTVSVDENAPEGSTILDFVDKVSDADATSPWNAVRVSIVTASVPFTIETTSYRQLQTTATLNAGSNPSYLLTVRATDNNGAVTGELTTDAQVIINVQPVNLVAPTFSGSSTMNVAEDTAVGSTIATVSASDTDSGLGGNVSYSIVSGNTGGDFQIAATTGRVTVKNLLDFDSAPTIYYLGIQATDMGTPPKSSTWTLTVSLTDVNDNTPIWSTSNTYVQTIAEDITGVPKSIYTMLVSDPDSGLNGDLVFSEVSQGGTAPDGSSKLLGVDATSGDIRLLAQPDREYAANYYLYARACDKGTPAKCSARYFLFTITDANDNTPNFGLCPKEISVAENLGSGVLIATLPATDSDAGVNGQIALYRLLTADGGASSPAGLFTVSAAGGVTTDTTPLDRESKSVYQFYITAEDNGSPRRTGSCLLNITVTDKNDNAPSVVQPIITSVSEAAPGGTVFYTIPGTDADTGPNAALLYEISAFTPANNFTVNNAGQLSLFTGDRLDRERHAAYNLTIKVRDQGTDPGQQTTTITVSVDVTDVNDNVPDFGATSIGRSVAENSAVGVNVGAPVAATDADIGAAASITYQIASILVPTSGGDYFDVTPTTGQLTVKVAALDRETRDIYIIRLVAYDNGSPALTGTTTVTITITDTNDNTPTFTSTYLTGVSADENLPVGSFVHHFLATDADIGANANLNYAINTTLLDGATVDTYFQINGTGHLTVKAPIDREAFAQLQFFVTCEDSGSPVRTGSASVNLVINDVNDNTPVFSPTFYNTEMYYKEDRTSITLTTVSATDGDATSNGIRYGWNTASQNFVMNVLTGAVSPGAQQSTSKDSLYVQSATATDAGSPQRTGTATVRVDTYDMNEVGVCVTYNTLATTFVARQSLIEDSLDRTLQFKYPTVRCGTWKYTSANSAVRACHYCVADNSTDSIGNIAVAKSFVPQSDLLTFWRLNTNGDPTATLQNTNFSATPITLVEGYNDGTSAAADIPWYQTPWGIAVLVLASVLGAALIGLAIGCLVYYLKHRNPSVKITQPKPTAKAPTVQRQQHQPPRTSKANNNKNVYRDQNVWGGTPQFGRSYQNSPGESQWTSRTAAISKPTPVS